MIYTKTPTGLENIDFSHELVKDINGNYQADMQHEKQDFNDYFEI